MARARARVRARVVFSLHSTGLQYARYTTAVSVVAELTGGSAPSSRRSNLLAFNLVYALALRVAYVLQLMRERERY
jgi:hypothetical protein